jgi:hypothetical protein
VGLKLIVALLEVIVPTAGGTDLLPLSPLEHPVMSTTETANAETIECALLDQRFIRLTMGHPSRPQGLSCSQKSSNAQIMSVVLFPALPVQGRTSTSMRPPYDGARSSLLASSRVLVQAVKLPSDLCLPLVRGS